MTSDHYDAFAVLGVALLMLMFVEMRLRSLFARHEIREERMVAGAVLASEGAISRVAENVRHIEELRSNVGDARLDIENIGAMVKMHDGRLGAIEERLMRAALLVPHPRREEPED